MREEAPVVYRVAEVAKLRRMGQRQVYEGLIRGEIPGIRIGKQWRISKVAFDAWLNQSPRSPNREQP
jgi:excisionase family DNA binding protein